MAKKVVYVCIGLLLIFCASHFGWSPVDSYSKGISTEERATAERLERIVRFLSEEIGVRDYKNLENLDKSAAYIDDSFQALGYSVKRQYFKANGQTFQNIIAVDSKYDSTRNTLIIGSHYDSCHNPGADDNASGVAGMLELARLLHNSPLDYNLKFVAFTNEEPPFFRTQSMGSVVFVRELQKENISVSGAVILEMLGYYSKGLFSQKYPTGIGFFYPNQADFIAVVGNYRSKHLVLNLYKHFRATQRFPVEKIVAPEKIPGIGFSDHWAFWQAGIPAVMVTDTAYLRNPNYHQPTDLPNTLNYTAMAKVVHGLKESILNLSIGDGS